MQIVQAPRASAIIHNLLRNRADSRPWLLPANVCPVVPLTFFKARIPFTLVDISPASLHMDMEQAQALVATGRYGGLLYVHTYGDPSTPEDSFAAIKSTLPDVLLVDDRCLCIPEIDLPGDTNADVRLYSTGYAKFVDLNRGGYAFLKDNVEYRSFSLPFEAQCYRDIEKAYKRSVGSGQPFEYQDTAWLETVGEPQSRPDYRARVESGLMASKARRAEINQIYREKLPLEIQLPQAYQDWRFNILVRDKKRILDAVFSAGLFASSHYASLAGVMADGCAPNAESLSNRVVNLFNDRHFTSAQAERVCEIILENLS